MISISVIATALLARAQIKELGQDEHSFVVKGSSDIFVSDGAQVCA